MLAAGTKVKISGSEEKKTKQEHIRHIKTTAKKCTKKCASRAKLFFFLIRLIGFFCLLVAVVVSGDVTRDDSQDDF